jgi:hypothetical protein
MKPTLHPVYRISTYIPPDAVDRVVAAVCAITPLRYGKYDRSAWWISGGTEQYQPTPGSNPSHGEIGEISRVATTRLEFCLPRDPELLRQVIDAGLRPSHPWEEPAIFVEEVLADIRSV